MPATLKFPSISIETSLDIKTLHEMFSTLENAPSWDPGTKKATRNKGVPTTWNVTFKNKYWPIMRYELDDTNRGVVTFTSHKLDDTKKDDDVSFTSHTTKSTVGTHETFTFVPVEGSSNNVVVYRFTLTVEWRYILLACLAWFRLMWELKGTTEGLRAFICSIENQKIPKQLML